MLGDAGEGPMFCLLLDDHAWLVAVVVPLDEITSPVLMQVANEPDWELQPDEFGPVFDHPRARRVLDVDLHSVLDAPMIDDPELMRMVTDAVEGHELHALGHSGEYVVIEVVAAWATANGYTFVQGVANDMV